MSGDLQKIAQARGQVERVRRKLGDPTPDAMDACAVELSQAVENLRQVETRLQSSPGGRQPSRVLYLEIAKLAHELQQVNALMGGAARFFEGWARLASAGAAETPPGYDSSGKVRPARTRQAGRLVLHG